MDYMGSWGWYISPTRISTLVPGNGDWTTRVVLETRRWKEVADVCDTRGVQAMHKDSLQATATYMATT